MITVTDRAKDALKGSLPPDTSRGLTLRLEARGSGVLGLVPGTERKGDYAVEHGGTTVLLIASALAARLRGARLDCEETPDGRQLIVTPPRGATVSAGGV